MKPITYIAAIAMLTAFISSPILAGDREKEPDRHKTKKTSLPQWYDHGMQVITNNAAAATPGHGWRYFTDQITSRAVVISPQGDYYYSRGKGLYWIAAEQSGS